MFYSIKELYQIKNNMLICVSHTQVKFKIKKLKVQIYKSNPKTNEYIYKKRHYSTYSTKEKPTPLIYCLQSLQGQPCGTI